MSTNRQRKDKKSDVKDIEEAGYKKLNPVTDAKEIRTKQKITEGMVKDADKHADEVMGPNEMLEGERTFTIPGNPKDLKIEIRWFDDGHRRVTIKLGELTTVVERDDLMTILFMLARRSQRRKAAVGFLQQIKKYTTIVGVVAQKPIAAGEEVKFEITLDFPVDDQGNVMLPKDGKTLNQIIT